MNEDKEFERFVKRAMEAGLNASSGQISAIERMARHEVRNRRWRKTLGVAFLSVASLVAVTVFRVMILPDVRERDTTWVENAICILCEFDGIDENELNIDSAGDMLLSWQDAPCANL